MSAMSSAAHGLERTFETKVSMTPPARIHGRYKDSPFTTSILQPYPATDSKKIGIPRSNAFGPFSPLPLENNNQSNRRLKMKSSTLKSSVMAPSSSDDDDDDDDENLYLREEGNHSYNLVRSNNASTIHRHTRARTEGSQKKFSGNQSKVHLETVQEPRRRAASMFRSTNIAKTMGMDMDEIEDNDDAPPPSPSPAGEILFPRRRSSIDEELLDSDSDDVEGIVLRAGAANVARRRVGSSRSISTLQYQNTMSSMIGFGGEIPERSYTTSAIKYSYPSQSSISASTTSSKISSQGSSSQNKSSSSLSSSPYKTPNKRRARMPSSSSAASRSRTLSQASPFITPIQSEEGSLFAMMPPLGERMSIDQLYESRHKRRSTGSFLPSTPSGAADMFANDDNDDISPSHNTKRSSLPLTSPESTQREKLVAMKRLESHEGATPGSASFDDSGVAFVSPAGRPLEKLTERSLGKHLGLKGQARVALESSVEASPSKAVVARRSASEQYHHHHQQQQQGSQRHFTVRERSSLANETRLSDAASSATNSPDVIYKRSSRLMSANSVPECLASPVRQFAPPRRTSLSTNSLDSHSVQSSYLTPQNYKNIVPLQTAFMSTGLASKRNRSGLGNADLGTGETLPPLPPKPNFVTGPKMNGHAPNMAAQLGLREVVAAANAHSAAVGKTTIMPDTPMKKPVFHHQSFSSTHAGHANKAVPLELTRNINSMLSPPSLPHGKMFDGNESSSSGGSAYGGDSPLLNTDCASPTLGLASVSGKSMWSNGSDHLQRVQTPIQSGITSRGEDDMSPRQYQSPEIQLHQVKNDASNRDEVVEENNRLSALRLIRPSAIRTRSAIMQHRPSLGLQRKSSFGPTSDQSGSSSIHSPVLGFDAIPSTPTRNSASIKWFEAAQLMTTPSPSSSARRRTNAKGRPDSFQNNTSNRSSRLRLSIGPSESENHGEKKRISLDQVFQFQSRFTVQSTIGEGEFSRVDKVEDRIDGCLYAIKRMKKPYLGPRDRIRRLEEVDILRYLGEEGGHMNIIQLIDAWEESGSLFIQSELCPCVDFAIFLQHNANMGGYLEEARLWKVLKELSDGLGYIHEKGVLHLDLKPANIFITEIATLKIGDFGLATRWPTVDSKTILQGANVDNQVGSASAVTTSSTTSSAAAAAAAAAGGVTMSKSSSNDHLEREGDRDYIAPEIIFQGRYSKAADVFSLGLILLEAAASVILPDNGEAWQKLRNDDLSDVDLSLFSNSLIHLISACLQSNPDKRPSAKEIQEHSVIQAVSRKVALGVHVSELDQLPVCDLPAVDSNRSLKSINGLKATSDNDNVKSSDADDTEMQDDLQQADEKLQKDSKEGEIVLHIRGALIHESIEFLIEILEAEEDPTARLFRENYCMAVMQPTTATLTTSIIPPLINIDSQVDNDDISASPMRQQIPLKASPLRQKEEATYEEDVEMDH